MEIEKMNSKEPIIIYADPDLLDLIPIFISNRKKDIEQLSEFLNKQNFIEIQRMGHTLKGVCASYGFIELGVLGKTLEEQAKTHDSNGIRTTMQEMDFIINNHVIEAK